MTDDNARRKKALDRHRPMDPAKREALNTAFRTATDLHAYCQTCGKLHYGTLEELKRGCPDAAAGSANSNTPNPIPG